MQDHINHEPLNPLLALSVARIRWIAKQGFERPEELLSFLQNGLSGGFVWRIAMGTALVQQHVECAGHFLDLIFELGQRVSQEEGSLAPEAAQEIFEVVEAVEVEAERGSEVFVDVGCDPTKDQSLGLVFRHGSGAGGVACLTKDSWSGTIYTP